MRQGVIHPKYSKIVLHCISQNEMYSTLSVISQISTSVAKSQTQKSGKNSKKLSKNLRKSQKNLEIIRDIAEKP